MKKRVGLLLIVVAAVAGATRADAQHGPRVPRIGYLLLGEKPRGVEVFREALRELGYVEGKNIAIDYRFAEGSRERLAELAAELVRLKVQVIVTTDTIATRAAKDATTAIPIVMARSGDPVRDGLVASFARPGGNVTGVAALTLEISAKRLELLKEAVPGIFRVAVLWNPENEGKGPDFDEAHARARALGLELQSLEVRSPEDVTRAFEAAARRPAGGLIVLRDYLVMTHRHRIVELAAKYRLPAIYDGRPFTEAGGLMAYGADQRELWRRAVLYVDKILKGARPADLPVEMPTRYELVVNLKTARALGLTIPPEVLMRADEVIK